MLFSGYPKNPDNQYAAPSDHPEHNSYGSDPAKRYFQQAAAIKANPCESGWLKNAIAELENRDVLDAYSDACALLRLKKKHLEEALRQKVVAPDFNQP